MVSSNRTVNNHANQSPSQDIKKVEGKSALSTLRCALPATYIRISSRDVGIQVDGKNSRLPSVSSGSNAKDILSVPVGVFLVELHFCWHHHVRWSTRMVNHPRPLELCGCPVPVF